MLLSSFKEVTPKNSNYLSFNRFEKKKNTLDSSFTQEGSTFGSEQLNLLDIQEDLFCCCGLLFTGLDNAYGLQL